MRGRVGFLTASFLIYCLHTHDAAQTTPSCPCPSRRCPRTGRSLCRSGECGCSRGAALVLQGPVLRRRRRRHLCPSLQLEPVSFSWERFALRQRKDYRRRGFSAFSRRRVGHCRLSVESDGGG